jgi:hypothetical protein
MGVNLLIKAPVMISTHGKSLMGGNTFKLREKPKAFTSKKNVKLELPSLNRKI